MELTKEEQERYDSIFKKVEVPNVAKEWFRFHMNNMGKVFIHRRSGRILEKYQVFSIYSYSVDQLGRLTTGVHEIYERKDKCDWVCGKYMGIRYGDTLNRIYRNCPEKHPRHD